jgi:hypothetical protein
MAQQQNTTPTTGASGAIEARRRASGPVDAHPYRLAWQTRDLDAWADALAPDVVMNSPVFRAPFEGRDAAVELFGVLFDALGPVTITHEFADGDSRVFFWHADIGGRDVAGLDLIRSDEHGEICEITVLIRPLVGIAVFAAAVGPPLAAKRGRLRGLVVRLLTAPLTLMFAVIDRVASRLTQLADHDDDQLGPTPGGGKAGA